MQNVIAPSCETEAFLDREARRFSVYGQLLSQPLRGDAVQLAGEAAGAELGG